MPTCAECGQDNPEGARFCNACGTELVERGSPREMRKTVTVLFCDVTGSTALGESLDPEPLRALLARYFEEMKEIVERHGGTVEKFIGDAVMAVFGVPAVHEDDALRALRAAVEMRDAFPGLGIEGRIGVSTGEVVTGTEERLATGDAVNVAARLEQAARPGEVLVSEATFRLARDAAEVEPVEPLALKGKSAPLPAFRLISVRAGAPAFTRRLDSPMVGREREGGLLRQAFERSRDERACHLFTILGPAGIGKSRLVAELLKGIGAEATVVSGRCLPYGEGITYWPLLEILEALGRELELGSPEETAWAARKLLEEAAGRRPLVVVLDDIHWAEPTFLDLVEHVADLSRDAPILLVCVARPELLDTRPGWGGGKLNATTILLEPLGEDEVGRLVANLLDEAPLPPGVLERVEAAAEGNPLFVEEMLAMLAEDGADVEIEIPPTIQALLAARLDRLDSEERDVLGRASVEGKVFHAGGVATLAPQELRPSVRGYLTGLVRKELIRPDRPSIEGEDAFRFRHLLIRDAAYQSLPKEERANLHERFVGWLESLGENVLGLGEIAGYHLEQAHGYLVELGQAERAKPLAARAASRLSAAGIAASRRGDLPSAVNLLGRAEALLPRDGPERLGLLPELGKVLGTMGRLVEADAVLTEAIDRAEAVGPRDVLLSATIARIALRMNSAPADRVAETRAEIERLLPELKRAGDDRTLAHALQAIAMTHQMLCNYDDFHAVAIDQLEHARRAGDPLLVDDAVAEIAIALIHGPTPVEDAIEQLRRLPAPRGAAGQADREVSLAGLYAMAGRPEAEELYRSSRERVRELGFEVSWAAYSMAGGWMALWRGEPAWAEPTVREGCDALIRMGERSYLSTAAAVLAHLLYELERDDEAEEWIGTAEETGSLDDLATQTEIRTVRALLLARRGDLAGAEGAARDAVDVADRGQSPGDRGSTRLVLASVLRLRGREDEALASAMEALSLFEGKGIVGYVDRARAFVAASPGG